MFRAPLYEIVLDVPQKGVQVAFGVLLHGPGQVWINNVQFVEVGSEVPLSNNAESENAPTNLDFAAS